MLRTTTWLAVVMLVCASACSTTTLAAESMVEVLWAAAPALEEERDPQLAKAALESNLKLMEGLMKVIPDSEPLYRMAAKAFSSYGFAFIEPRIWEHADLDDPAGAALRRRAKDMYERATRYARKRLALIAPALEEALHKDVRTVQAALAADHDEDTIDAMFWLGQAWGQLIAIDPDDIENVANMGVVEALTQRVAESSPDHEDGTIQALLGMAQAVMGSGLAGDLGEAKAAFERAIRATRGRFLVPKFLYGRYYCAAVLDRSCYEKALGEVILADPNALPRRRLTNVLAQRWARYWLKKAPELF